jgi:transposase
VSTEVFAGNTQDPQTFGSQVKKAAEQFGCDRVTFVGDRGMIKSTQIKELPEGLHYITAITKPQIRSLIKKGHIQLDLFGKDVFEVEVNGVRYVLRRNPIRADEVMQSRLDKQRTIEKLVDQKNLYLKEHPRAGVATAVKQTIDRIKRLKLDKWMQVQAEKRSLSLQIDKDVLKDESCLDGCYVIKTDLPKNAADKQIVHDRYKDLALVEKAFRNSKTTFLEVRPIFVRTEKSTRGHVLVVMLSYMIIRKLQQAWREFDLTAEEGIEQLITLCSMEMKIKDQGSCLKIPRPREQSRKLLKALKIEMPIVLPHRNVRVVTRKKLMDRRKSD